MWSPLKKKARKDWENTVGTNKLSLISTQTPFPPTFPGIFNTRNLFTWDERSWWKGNSFLFFLTTANWSRIQSKCLKFLWWKSGHILLTWRRLAVNGKKVAFALTWMLLSCNLKTKVLADVHIAAMRGLKYVLPCVYGISNFRTQFNLMKSASLLSGQRFRVKQITEAYRKHVTTRTWFPRGCCTVARSATSVKEKIKAAKGLDNVTACVQPSPSVPLRWCIAAHTAPWD